TVIVAISSIVRLTMAAVVFSSSFIYLSLVTIRCLIFFFFNDTATTEIYTLSLHDALPIFGSAIPRACLRYCGWRAMNHCCLCRRSEEHTSELQSRGHLVCRLLLEKKNV